ncbi:MAG TPA: hypothetical protein VLI05_07250 [Candidatus Saccharimonadia bacterium]|nr:hypothetical protein [Candidatus Saccharimonadia bacterium]
MIKLRRLWLVVLMAWAALAPLAAQAYTFPPGGVMGRGQFYGYFENRFDNCGASVIDAGLGYNPATDTYTPGYGAPQFIAEVQSHLFSGFDAQDQTGAAFIVLTMLGVQGPATGGNHATGVNMARSLWTQWVTQVNGYAAVPGKVEWDRLMNFPFDGTSTYLNSMYQGRNDCGGPKPPDIQNPNDDTFYTDNEVQSHLTIIFHNNDGSVYMLKRNCANPIGPFSPLNDFHYSLDGTVSPYGGAPALGNAGSGGIIEAGQSYQLTPSITNPSGYQTNSTNIDVDNLSPAYIHNNGVTAPGAPVTGDGYLAGACTAGSDCWFWRFGNGIPPNTTYSEPGGLNFTVDPATPDGTSVCFRVVVWPNTEDPTSSLVKGNNSGPYCYTVYKPHYPGIIGTSGDVHAGGGLCTAVGGSLGSITANSQSQSLGQYVVSSNGPVSGFGSNNVAGGAAATLGNQAGLGNYYDVCRPDLVATAKAALLSGAVSYQPLAPGTYNLASLPASPEGVYWHTGGGDVIINAPGGFNQRITIVSTSVVDNIIINGNIILNDSGHTANQSPSLGIISAADILVSSAASRVDGYVFADGTINTCLEGVDVASAPACLGTLTVNGFLMGHGLSFRRLGPKTSAAVATVGEQINMTGQLYLNPPKFFDSAAVVNLLQNQGEKPPLN